MRDERSGPESPAEAKAPGPDLPARRMEGPFFFFFLLLSVVNHGQRGCRLQELANQFLRWSPIDVKAERAPSMQSDGFDGSTVLGFGSRGEAVLVSHFSPVM